MSRIYFHTPDRTAEVGGSERAYFNALAADITLAILHPDAHRDVDWIREITVDAPQHVQQALSAPMPDVMVNQASYRDWARWVDTWCTWARVSYDNGGLRVGESVLPFGEMALNTLVAMNSPQLSFVAHVHGCCESHGWIPAENAEWLAEVIDRGRESNVFRAGQGWEDVADLAREVQSGMPGPIVMSYSVCESFPNAWVADWQPPEGAEDHAWYDLPKAEQWELGVRGLEQRDWPFPMGPDRQDQGFLSGKSVFDLLATRWTGQLA
jgi:hypothetical protein